MTRIFAYECYADGDVFHFLNEVCRLPLVGFHAFGQGEVVNEVLVRQRGDIGMVDEDPGRAHHSARDQTVLVSETPDVMVRRSGDRHLIVIRPELEECFLHSMQRLKLDSKLPRDANRLRALLNLRDKRRHALFREELARLHEESRQQRQETLVTEVERAVREILK